MIIGHYGQTGADTAGSEPCAGQSIIGLTGEECSLPWMCGDDQRGSGVA